MSSEVSSTCRPEGILRKDSNSFFHLHLVELMKNTSIRFSRIVSRVSHKEKHDLATKGEDRVFFGLFPRGQLTLVPSQALNEGKEVEDMWRRGDISWNLRIPQRPNDT